MELQPMVQITHSGWLVKKSQKRYYILFEGQLSWFSAFKEPVGDFLKDARGTIKLDNCAVGLFPDKRTYLILSTPTNAYLVKAKSDEEADEWLAVISSAIRAFSATSRSQDPEFALRHNKAGYLNLRSELKFILIKNGILSIFQSEEMTDKAEMDLQYFTFSLISDTIHLTHNTDSTLSLKLSSPYGSFDASLWMKTMQRHSYGSKNQLFPTNDAEDAFEETDDIKLSGWLILQKTNKKRYFSLADGLLTWYSDDPSKGNVNIEGTINLLGAAISKPKGTANLTFAVRDAQGGFTQLRGITTQAEVDKWIEMLAIACRNANAYHKLGESSETRVATEELEGWVDGKHMGKKKAHRIYLVLKNNSLRLYDGHPIQYARLEEDIYLAQSTCTKIEPLSFLVSAGPSQALQFTTQSEDETKRWVACISGFINTANTAITKTVLKNQWFGIMIRIDSLRWVVITRQRQLLGFQAICNPESISAANATFYIDLFGATVSKGNTSGKASFTVKDTKGTVISLITSSPSDAIANEWIDMINEVSTARGEIKPQSATFGVTIEALCEKEGTTIPNIVTRCIDFIIKNGTDQQGIFRLSGSTSEIKEYTDLLDEGQEVTFSRSTDVHAVSGLLKLWLRCLPDPLIHSTLYPAFLSTNDPDILSQLARRLSEAHYRVCSLLFHFLHKMAKYSDVTSMDSSNIAIVFGPNVLTNPYAGDLNKLQDTPYILRTTKVLIDKCHQIFPRDDDAETETL